MKTCSCDQREFFPAKARFSENGFEHIITFRPGFICERFLADRNDPTNHGTTCLDLLFLVHNDFGAVQFSLMSGWYPNWGEDKRHNGPLPSDLGVHSPIPQYDGQTAIQNDCPWTGGKPCYYDGSTLNAEEPFNILIMKGETALWKFLEKYHCETFTIVKATEETP